MFDNLVEKLKANPKRIVYTEGTDARILESAARLKKDGFLTPILIGAPEEVKAAAVKGGFDIEGLEIIDPATYPGMDEMVEKMVTLRKGKMTAEQYREALSKGNYFGTMLVVLGYADGLVSGAVNSTANTVRPALQVIKTKPGQRLVSGAFLMCFKDHVTVFSDCAINLNPDAEQLAEIALQSAVTAKAFGIEPKVGMLSYSTLGSGKGPDVDIVEEATRIVKEKAPDLPVVGSIQFDAAWSPDVAATKAKGNDVAGHVNVFVFPDLCSGNIGYKAVQRSSGALAIGPVLQGLNKPVNDLSRGATVQDIINTIALTAIEAQ